MSCRETSTRLLLVLAVSVASLAVCRSAQAQDVVKLRVYGDVGSLPPPAGTADGTAWTEDKAFRLLQDAITRAQEILGQNQDPEFRVEIWVAATASTNPYRPDKSVNAPEGNLDPNTTFSMHNRIQQYGGFLGDNPSVPGGETQRSQRNPEINITVLSGLLMFCGEPGAGSCCEEHTTPGCANGACCAMVCETSPLCCISGWGENCVAAAMALCGCPVAPGVDLRTYHVVTADGVGPSARLSGFTVTGGRDVGNGGGGLSVYNANPVIARCRFTDNIGFVGGAVEVDASGTPPGYATFVDCALVGNQASEGGAMALKSGTGRVTFVNCLFAENTATVEGGAIKGFGAPQSALEAWNCTFTANSVEPPGVGGAISLKSTGPVTITNCILWGDIPVNDEIHMNPGAAVVSYSDVQQESGVWPGTDNINADPNFVGAGNYHLFAPSPCIDAGHNDPEVQHDGSDVDDDENTGEYTPDLDLKPRVRKGTLGGCPVGVVDMGAYEFIPPGCPADCGGGSPDGVVGVVDFLELLDQWFQQCSSCDIMSPPGVGVGDFLELLGSWGTCGMPVESPPKSVQDCIARYGFDAQLLEHCICAVAPCTQGCPPAGCH